MRLAAPHHRQRARSPYAGTLCILATSPRVGLTDPLALARHVSVRAGHLDGIDVIDTERGERLGDESGRLQPGNGGGSLRRHAAHRIETEASS